jgi:uncharacterized protein (TIGR04255 family)
MVAQHRVSTRPADLPDYENPPVNEVVIGIQFEQTAITGAHIGMFWAQMRDEFPKAFEQPPLDRRIENFEPQRFSPQIVEFSQVWRGSRHWLTSVDDVHLIQIQNDRLVYNWRRRSDNAVYPHFEELQEKFWQIVEKWSAFLENEKEHLNLTQWELSYINHILTPDGQPTLGEILSFWGEKLNEAMGGAVDAGRIEAQKILRDGDTPWARFFINVTTAVRADQTPLVIFELTVRGSPGNGEGVWDITRNRIFQARRRIVSAFDTLTTEGMHALWGRQR